MARIRTIKPEMWESEKVGNLSPIARLLFIGLISLADDDGRGRGEIRYLKSRLFPYDHQNATRRIPAYIQEISKSGLVQFYSGDDGCAYYCIPGFNDNQRIDKPRPSRIPKPPDSKNDPRSLASVLDQGSRNVSRKGREEEGAPPSDTITALKKKFEDNPNTATEDEKLRMLRAHCRSNRIGGHPDAITDKLRGYINRQDLDFTEIERRILSPDARGQQINDLHNRAFRPDSNGKKEKRGIEHWVPPEDRHK